MATIIEIDSVSKYNRLRGVETLHPLISVLDYKDLKIIENVTYKFGIYAVFFKETLCGDLKYGKQTYDYQEESLIFAAPEQNLTVGAYQAMERPKGKVMLFHPDLIRGTELGEKIYTYRYFDYQTNEALHLSARERDTFLDLLNKIDFELDHNLDKHSHTIIVDTLQLILNYSERFYDRQFITRATVNSDIVQRFEQLLNQYFLSDKPRELGLPSVNYFSNELNLSANYFGDLVRKEMGISAQDYIQTKLIEFAKTKIFDTEKSISEVAYELGFKYSQHFHRLFKKKVGLTPIEYRNLN